MEVLAGAVLIALLLVLVYVYSSSTLAAVPFIARDGLPYRVHRSLSEPRRAADILAELNRRAVTLLRVLRGRYQNDTGPRGVATRRLLSNYSPDGLVENSPKDIHRETAFTVNKGKTLAICLRERDPTLSGDPSVYDFQNLTMLTFVLYHEMAHIAVEEDDHTHNFWRTFRWLLEEAEKSDIVSTPDYSQSPQDYCGLNVNYNPRWDPTVTSI